MVSIRRVVNEDLDEGWGEILSLQPLYNNGRKWCRERGENARQRAWMFGMLCPMWLLLSDAGTRPTSRLKEGRDPTRWSSVNLSTRPHSKSSIAAPETTWQGHCWARVIPATSARLSNKYCQQTAIFMNSGVFCSSINGLWKWIHFMESNS